MTIENTNLKINNEWKNDIEMAKNIKASYTHSSDYDYIVLLTEEIEKLKTQIHIKENSYENAQLIMKENEKHHKEITEALNVIKLI